MGWQAPWGYHPHRLGSTEEVARGPVEWLVQMRSRGGSRDWSRLHIPYRCPADEINQFKIIIMKAVLEEVLRMAIQWVDCSFSSRHLVGVKRNRRTESKQKQVQRNTKPRTSFVGNKP